MYVLVPGPVTDRLVYERPGDVYLRGRSEEREGSRWYTQQQFQSFGQVEGPGAGRMAVHDSVNKGSELQRPPRRLRFLTDGSTLVEAVNSMDIPVASSDELLTRLREKLKRVRVLKGAWGGQVIRGHARQAQSGVV